MLWNSVLQACLQAYSKIPSLVWVLLAHRQLVQLVHDHALECWRTKAEFHPIAVFKFLGCQIKTGCTCAMIGSGFRLEGTCSHTLGYMKIIILSFALSFFCHLLLSFFFVLSFVPVIFLSFFCCFLFWSCPLSLSFFCHFSIIFLSFSTIFDDFL